MLYPSVRLSLFVNADREHCDTMFKHLTMKGTHLREWLSEVQEHEKAFTV